MAVVPSVDDRMGMVFSLRRRSSSEEQADVAGKITGLDRQDADRRGFRGTLAGARADRDARRERSRSGNRRIAATALALALFPRSHAGIADRTGRSPRARRFSAVGTAATPHVGRRSLLL